MNSAAGWHELAGFLWKENLFDRVSLCMELPVQRSNRFRRCPGLLSDPCTDCDVSNLYATLSQRYVKRVSIGAQSGARDDEVRVIFQRFFRPYEDRPTLRRW
jgi:hypothetical protein